MNNAAAHTRLDTHQKALQINVDKLKYGTFAEIGAGQEVAAWFFKVGGASGTVAKTMCAYDMRVSDAVYGKSARYVSKERLKSMLDHEYGLLVERLNSIRGENTSFFVFADTVSAKNFAGTNECHGWMGLRYQTKPGQPACDMILHINLYDDENLIQQRTIGTLGVNLLYGAFYDFENKQSILTSLLDGIGPGRIEIDYIEFNGKEIQSDPIENNLSLLRHGLARAVMFDEAGAGVAPTEIFHSRPILIERGGYRALNKLDQEYAASALKLLSKSSNRKEKEPIFVLESTINNLLKVIQPTDAEMVEHTKRLCSTGHPVMISTFSEAYHLTGFLRRFSSEPMAFLMSVAMLMQVFQEERYTSLGAGILEACAKLFGDKVHLYAYPMEGEKLSKYLEQNGFDMESYDFPRSGLATVKEIMPKSVTRHLYRYLLDQGIIVGV